MPPLWIARQPRFGVGITMRTYSNRMCGHDQAEVWTLPRTYPSVAWSGCGWVSIEQHQRRAMLHFQEELG